MVANVVRDICIEEHYYVFLLILKEYAAWVPRAANSHLIFWYALATTYIILIILLTEISGLTSLITHEYNAKQFFAEFATRERYTGNLHSYLHIHMHLWIYANKPCVHVNTSERNVIFLCHKWFGRICNTQT